MTFLIVVILIFYVLRLNSRINKLEEDLNLLRGPVDKSAPKPAPKSEEAQTAGSKEGSQPQGLQLKADSHFVATEPTPEQVAHEKSVPKPVPVVEIPAPPTGPTAFDNFIEWVKEDILVKLGGFLLLIAFGWFVSYAVANNWIGELGRILLGIFVGVGVIGLGEWRIRSYVHQGGIFLVLGSGIVLLSVFAGRELYDLFSPLLALIAIFLTAAYVSFAALRFNNQHLGVAGVVLAMIAPLFVASPEPSLIGLYSYLLVATVGAIWVVYKTGWRLLGSVALLFVIAYSFPYYLSGVSEVEMLPAILFANIFTIVFFGSNLASMFIEKINLGKAHVWSAVGTGVYLVTWILTAADGILETTLLLVWMIVFAAGAYVVAYKTAEKEPLYVYLGVSLVCLATATANEFTGGALVVAYTLEVTAIVFGVYRVLRDSTATARASLLFAGPMILSINTMLNYVHSTVLFHKDFTIIVVLLISLFSLGLYLKYEERRGKGDPILSSTASGMLIAFITYLGILTALELDGGILIMMYAIEMLLIIIFGYYLYGDSKVAAGLSLLYTIPITLSLEIILNYSNKESLIHPDFLTLLTLLFVATFIAVVFRAKSRQKSDETLWMISNVFFVVAIAYGLIITALEFSGPALLAMLSFEIAILVILARLVFKTSESVRNMSALFVLPLFISGSSIFSTAWEEGVLHSDFFGLITFIVVLFVVGFFLFLTKREGDDSNLVPSYMLVGAVLSLILTWLILHALYSDDIATMISLIIYTILGLVTFVKGRVEEKVLYRYAGGVLIGFVVGRLLLIEVWEMELTGRIITFFVIGTLLIMTAFVGRKKDEKEAYIEN